MKFLFFLFLLIQLYAQGSDTTTNISKNYILNIIPNDSSITYGLGLGLLPDFSSNSNTTVNGIFLDINLASPLFVAMTIPILPFALLSKKQNNVDSLQKEENYRCLPINKTVNGVSLSIIAMNWNLNGVSASLFNDHYKMNGIVIGGMNIIKKSGSGVQIGLFNLTENFTGLQIGLINASKNFTGLQIGLWNVINGHGYPVLNFSF